MDHGAVMPFGDRDSLKCIIHTTHDVQTPVITLHPGNTSGAGIAASTTQQSAKAAAIMGQITGNLPIWDTKGRRIQRDHRHFILGLTTKQSETTQFTGFVTVAAKAEEYWRSGTAKLVSVRAGATGTGQVERRTSFEQDEQVVFW